MKDENQRLPNSGSRPVPDPTVLTDAAIAKAVVALHDYINGQIQVLDERLAGIDKATELRIRRIDLIDTISDSTIKIAADLAGHWVLDDERWKARSHHDEIFDALLTERFRSVQTQFNERDVLSQRESTLNKIALDAAFSASKEAVASALTAQKEGSAKQDETNQKAIDKSELATAEKINKLAELFQTTTDALADKIDDVKERVGEVATTANGTVREKVGARDDRAAVYALLGLLVMVTLGAVALIGLIISRKP